MFICPDCEKTRMEYARGFMRSAGQCEICEKTADCLDARDYKAKPRASQMKKLENLTDALVADVLATPDTEILLEAELHKAREIIAGLLLWNDPAYKPSPSESLEKLLADARQFISLS